MNEPRRDRWVRLYDLGRALQKSNPELSKLGRRALRQRVYRIVRESERFHDEVFTMTWRNRLYVSVSALDRVAPIGDQRLGELEIVQGQHGQKLRALERQSNAHGARILKLERWRQLTERYFADCADLDCAENDSDPLQAKTGVRACAR